MYEMMTPIRSIVIGLCEGRDVDIGLVETLSDTILLLPDIDKATEIGLLIMCNLIGDAIQNMPRTLLLFKVITNKYYNEYKSDTLKNYQFSDVFNEILANNGGE